MRHLSRVIRRRVWPVVGACVLLAGGIGAGVLAGGGTAQAAACPGTAVAATVTCTDLGTLNFSAGALTMTVPTALAWAGTDNGLNQQLVDTTVAQQSYVADDATGTGAGWNVTASATVFTGLVTPFPTLPAGSFTTNSSLTSQATIGAPTATCTGASTCTLPNDAAVTYPLTIPTAAVKIYDAALNTGLGSITISPVGWWVAVPANAVPQTYTSTVTLEILSAP
jgi:hypothetical protein